MSQQNFSQSEANKVIRVLNGNRLTYTVTVHHADGRKTEWQSNFVPDVQYNENTRRTWIREKAKKEGYDTYEVMPFTEGDVIRVEDNNLPKKDAS